jgi:hypothetical protein
VLERMHGYITGWVLPRIFAVASGSHPPLVIATTQPD